MRSIRRSLLGYLLLLLAFALGGVGTLVDRFANGAIRQREASEADRIEQAFAVRKQEVKAKFDADLMTDAKGLAGEVHRHTKTLVWQAPRQPGVKILAPPEPPVVLRFTEDDARQYLLRMAMLQFAPGPHPLPALAPVVSAEPIIPTFRPGGIIPSQPGGPRPNPYPFWADFAAPIIITRVHTTLTEEFRDDDRPSRFQFTIVCAFRGGRKIVSVKHLDLESSLPIEQGYLEPQQLWVPVEPKHDDVHVPEIGLCRRVVLGNQPSGQPISFGLWLPTPPPPAYLEGVPYFSPRNLPDTALRVFVHTVRPYSELESSLTAIDSERDEQLESVRNETRTELTRLRTRLILIGCCTFAALVLGGWFFVARGLAPLHTLSDAVSQVSEKDFRLPVVASDLGRELAPIHARITQTLTLLQRAFAREKQAVADISHELRTPIASLLATIDVALRKPRTPEQYRSTLEECRLISRQLGQLVERIMTLALLDAGNDRMVITRTDAVDLAGGCVAVIRPLAAANNVSVNMHATGSLMFDTDVGKLREILINLLHNAIEYNRFDGTIDLLVRSEANTVIFEVQDTGIGMTPEVKEKIFERFYRADASRTATGVHAGLGLAIVKEYIARLGGVISVESEPGVGTTFRVALPLNTEPTTPPITPESRTATPAEFTRERDPVPTGS